MLQESNRIELKAVLNDKLEKEIVAFLNNHEGGILYIGIDDKGRPVENSDMDSMQLKIADRIKNNILPSTLGLFDIITEYIENIPVTKIIVSSGLEKPYYIKNKGMSPNGCYMRIGTSTQPMTTDLIDELYAKRIHTTLRNIPSPRQDLTFAQLKIYYQERRLELNNRFANSLELLTPDGKYNYVAYLLADENGVSIKVAKYAGKDKVDLRENEEYGYCSLINAIVHNDFSREIPPVFEIFCDRMEFTSYGGLIQGQSREDFFSGSSMPRNRELMRVFKDVGLVEQLGSGMSRILNAYDRTIFEISEHFIKVVFPFSWSDENEIMNIPKLNGDENGDEIKILLLLRKEPDITAKKISEKVGFSTRKVSRIVKKLRESGKITRIGSDRKGYWEVNKKI